MLLLALLCLALFSRVLLCSRLKLVAKVQKSGFNPSNFQEVSGIRFCRGLATRYPRQQLLQP